MLPNLESKQNVFELFCDSDKRPPINLFSPAITHAISLRLSLTCYK